MDVSSFDFSLPPEAIAQQPTPDRDSARLLVMERSSGNVLAHTTVRALSEFVRPTDLMVMNETRVFPARLLGRRDPSGGAVECLLVRRLEDGCWEALMHPGQKLHPGARVEFPGPSGPLRGEVVAQQFHGRRTVRLWTDSGADVDRFVDEIGHMPLPPYIHRPDGAADRERYQTVFAKNRGSIAAPTAGLHFTRELLADLDARGVARTAVTLHVGYGTFKPVRVEQVEDHVVDPEWYEIEPAAAATINDARDNGRRVVAVGTTTTRALEASVRGSDGSRVESGAGVADLFLYPGQPFRVIGGLMTNFHLPKSSLLMLVCGFAGHEPVMAAYNEAVSRGYRFYSYGDAMLIV